MVLVQKTGDAAEKEKYIHLLEIAILGGAIILLIQPIMEWLFDINFTTGTVAGATSAGLKVTEKYKDLCDKLAKTYAQLKITMNPKYTCLPPQMMP